MKPPVPSWLEGFEANFSAMLRTPLDRSTGTLRAEVDRYPSALVDLSLPRAEIPATERLAVYNRQYWFRLFGVLQNEFRLTCALLGPWHFNRLASLFLQESPPAAPDLARAVDGFVQFARRFPIDAATVNPQAALQAAEIDEGFRNLFWAPRLSPEAIATFQQHTPEQLVTGRLRPSGRFVVIEEYWPLIDLRRSLSAAPTEQRALPAPHANGRSHAAIVAGDSGPIILPLHPLQATLYQYLQRMPLVAALSAIEGKASATQATTLASDVQTWLQTSVRLGFWSEVDPS